MSANANFEKIRAWAADVALTLSKAAEVSQDAAREPLDWLVEEVAWELYEAGAVRCIEAQRKGHRSMLTLIPPNERQFRILKQFAEMAIEMRRDQPPSPNAASATDSGDQTTREKPV